MNAPRPHRPVRHRQGFTLLEVLMAVAVIAILMGIIIPALGGAQTSARRAKTRAQFAQWSTAIEQFRQEYGYYPNFTSFLDGMIDGTTETAQFVETLSGRKIDGTTLSTNGPGETAGNKKRISFSSFGTSDLTPDLKLQDAFGNTEIVVVMDKNLSGTITFNNTSADDYTTAPGSVTSAGGEVVPSPAIATTIIRAGVAFYSAGDGKTPVTSW